MRWKPMLAATAALAALTVPVGLVGGPAAAGYPPDTRTVQTDRVRWGPCEFDVGTSGARCATVSVPLDYRRPDGRQIGVRISRVRSADPDMRRGTLIINQGGPSVHLTDASTFGKIARPELLDAYDVVSFDQRGFGASAPIRCRLQPDQQYTWPWPLPGGEPAVRANAEQIARQCERNAGDMLPFLGTVNVARDMDRIRQALGEEKISFLGMSYGSLLGSAYDSLFPERVDRMLLDANIDPTQAWRGTFRDSLTTEVDVRFGDFAVFAAARHAEYGLGDTRAEIQRTFLELVRRLDSAPLATPRGTLAGTQLRISMFAAMFDDDTFPVLAELLKASRDGDAAVAGDTAGQLFGWWDEDNIASGQYAVFCADSRWPRSPAIYAAQAAADAKAFPLTGGASAAIWPCAFWPGDPIDPPIRVSSQGRPNVLLTNNLRDPGTGYSAAQALRRQFGDRARLVGIDHGGHGGYLYSGNACAVQVGTDFLVTGARPVKDFICPAEHAGLRGALERLTATDGAPGALAEVRDARGTAVLSSGVADVRSRRQLSADDRVRVWSNTKTFVATVTLQLTAEGKVDLDAPVERYLPGLIRGGGNDGREITVRQLLQHTSGLPDFDSDVFGPDGGYYRHRLDHHTPVELVAAAIEQPRLSKPGAKFNYSTTNYVVAGLLIEAVTGRQYAEEARDRIIRPLRLRNTFLPGDLPVIPGSQARGYAHLDANDQLNGEGKLIDATVLNPSMVWAGGELVSTMPDLNTFFAALLGGRLLPAAQLAEMKRTVPADVLPGAEYGLGLIRVPLSCGGEYWTHGGTGIGFQTRLGLTMDGRQVGIVHTSAPVTAKLATDTVKAVDTALCEATPARKPVR